MAIHIMYGPPGSGKTLYFIKLIRQFFFQNNDNVIIFHNFFLSYYRLSRQLFFARYAFTKPLLLLGFLSKIFRIHNKIAYLRPLYKPCRDRVLQTFVYMPPQNVFYFYLYTKYYPLETTKLFFIDEAHRVFPSKSYAERGTDYNSLLAFATIHRQTNSEIYCTTQDPMLLAQPLRDICEYLIKIVNVSRFTKLAGKESFLFIANWFQANSRPIMKYKSETYNLSRALFSLYDTKYWGTRLDEFVFRFIPDNHSFEAPFPVPSFKAIDPSEPLTSIEFDDVRAAGAASASETNPARPVRQYRSVPSDVIWN